ncbi:MAG: hypothetical protein II947_06710 [Bacteroidaceae bacterium]|nr:hypothetical protein [Bacteroidaceae bacterium]
MSEILFTIEDEIMIVVSGVSGEMGDGTTIGDGGEGDGTVGPSVKYHGNQETYGDLW